MNENYPPMTETILGNHQRAIRAKVPIDQKLKRHIRNGSHIKQANDDRIWGALRWTLVLFEKVAIVSEK